MSEVYKRVAASEQQRSTPFLKAKWRIVDEFAAEAEALGLKADTHLIGSHYRNGEAFIELQTEPEPVKGNKTKMKSLEAAGYHLNVYVPYGWGRRRGFTITVTRKIVVTAADEELLK